MTMRLLAGECRDKHTCPGVWEDDEDPGGVIVVGRVVDPSPVPLGAGEMAVSLRRETIASAVAEG